MPLPAECGIKFNAKHFSIKKDRPNSLPSEKN
jgi:hypothetical protein